MPVPTAAQFDDYAAIHDQVAAAIAGLNPAQLQAIPLAEEWSIQQILIHLADSEVVGYERLRRVIAEDHPFLQSYDEAAWGSNLLYDRQDSHLALNLFKLLRQASVSLLRQLPAETWERIGQHAERGEVSLYALFLTYLDHGTVHLRQIIHTRQQL